MVEHRQNEHQRPASGSHRILSSLRGVLVLSLAYGVFFPLLGCAAHVLQHERAAEVLRTEEYDQKLNVKLVEPPPSPEVKITVAAGTAPNAQPPQVPHSAVGKTGGDAEKAVSPEAGGGKKKKGRKRVSKAKDKSKGKETGGTAASRDAGEDGPAIPMQKAKGPRQPEIEDAQGFNGRRPAVDPFRVGEKVTLGLSYFNINAGSLDIEVKPFAIVNNQKAYQFQVTAKSNSFFSHIYAVEDTALTYVSYDDLIPFNLQISIKESKQLAEARTFFDWGALKANYWQKRITKEHGEQSKKLDWSIQSFSQNVVSAAYYLRCFTYEVGKTLAFRVADEGKNIVFTGEVLKREKLSTDVGELNTIRIRPQITVDGVFAPVGDLSLWITDDDRKFIARMEAKIKIGTLVAKIRALDKGRE